MNFLGKWLMYCTVGEILGGEKTGVLAVYPESDPFSYHMISPTWEPTPPESAGIFNVYENNGTIVLQNDMREHYVAYYQDSVNKFGSGFVVNPDPSFADPVNASVFFVDQDLFKQAIVGSTVVATFLYQGHLIGVGILGILVTSANLSPGEPISTTFSIQIVTPAPTVLRTTPYAPGYDLTNIDLSNAELSGADLRLANFTGAKLNQTSFDAANLSGAILPNQDLTKLTEQTKRSPPTLQGTSTSPTILRGSTIPFAMLGLNWRWIDLTNATIPDLPSNLDGLNATGTKLAGLNNNNLTGISWKRAVFDNAVLDGLGLANADLSGASMINASLHGTILTNANLSEANMTGAQLGAIGARFMLPLSLQSALEAGTVSAVSPTFAQNEITLSSSAALSTLATGRVWSLDDAGNNITYTIRLETDATGTQSLMVYARKVAASLVGAYMPNAKLTGANLYAVTAAGAQFYADTGVAAIDGSAILEEADVSNANLSSLNLTQAQLLGTHFAGAQLFNARFTKANLTPAASGVATDLSGANLQGADFTDAQLYGAILANAAVAVPAPSTSVPNQGGVYLFTLPFSGDSATLQQYTSELNGAANRFSLNPRGDALTLQKYVTALQNNTVATLKTAFLEQSPPIKLSDAAQIQMVSGETNIWQIVDGSNSFTLWERTDNEGHTELYVSSALPNVRAAFNRENHPLRWQASVTLNKTNQQWEVDNDSQNPGNLDLGYVKFVIMMNGDVLDVYGSAVRIERLGANNQLVIDTESCNLTQIMVGNMNSDTSCPNGSTLAVNQRIDGVNWDVKWLRARTPPKPPSCVPTDSGWCPQFSSADSRSIDDDK